MHRITPLALALSMAFAGQALADNVAVTNANASSDHSVSYGGPSPFTTTATAIITPLGSAGDPSSASPIGNTVTLENFDASGYDIVGGAVSSASPPAGFGTFESDVSGNTVRFFASDDGSTHHISGVVYGGVIDSTDSHTANNNVVNIVTNSGTTSTITVGNNLDTDIAIISGAWVDNAGSAVSNQVNINGEGGPITVYGEVHGAVVRGSGDVGAYGAANAVNVNDNVTINGVVFGGFADNGKAHYNKVTINGGSGTAMINGSVHGGFANNGKALYNEVTIDSGSSGTATINGSVVGGSTAGTGNDADHNSVTINDATITGDGKVYGGHVIGSGNAQDNKVTLGAGAHVSDWIAGGYTADGDVIKNNVTINGAGATVAHDVHGGISITGGDAQLNSVVISAGTV
jgi:hypothetical protein